MDFKAEQEKFDKIKWLDSVQAGKDMCGSYEFCGNCKKQLQNPCARAANSYQNGYIRIAVVRAHI